MRFPRLNASTTSSASSKSKISGWVSKAKEFLVPQTVEARKARFTQYKDLGIFVGSILVVYIFEDKIRNFIEIDTDELRRMTEQMWLRDVDSLFFSVEANHISESDLLFFGSQKEVLGGRDRVD